MANLARISKMTRIQALAALLCLTASAVLAPVFAQTTVAVRSFDEPLAPYGYWVDDPTYGRVWRPRDIGPDWRPYTYGRWVYTSEYGWVWVSEEQWGWVAYHYGQWVWSGQYGWVWVAGDVWGPAWVEWCTSNGYIGWTPMSPQPYWQSGYYYGSYDCAAPAYYSRTVYVAQDRFAGPSVSAVVVTPALNASIAARATNTTSYSRSGATIVNRSVDVAKLQAATAQTITPLKIVRSQTPLAPGASAIGKQTLRIYQPRITATGTSNSGASMGVKSRLDPTTGQNTGEIPGGFGSPPGSYSGGLPLPSIERGLPGGIGDNGPSAPSIGGGGGIPGSVGGIGGGLIGGRRR